MLLDGSTEIKIVGIGNKTLFEVYKLMLANRAKTLYTYGWCYELGAVEIPMPLPALQISKPDMYEVSLSNGKVFTCGNCQILFKDMKSNNFLIACPFLSGQDRLVLPYIPSKGIISRLLHILRLDYSYSRVFISKVFLVATKDPIFEVDTACIGSLILGCVAIVRFRPSYYQERK